MEGKRPGGLTALAVINFIFGGLGLLGLLVLAGWMLLSMGNTEGLDEQQQEVLEKWREIGVPMVVFLVALGLVSLVLLILSGIGYLKQKRFLGRTLGTAYGVLGVVNNLVSASNIPPELGGGFTMGTMVNLVYPVLTLFLLNTTFKHDFHD